MYNLPYLFFFVLSFIFCLAVFTLVTIIRCRMENRPADWQKEVKELLKDVRRLIWGR